jgi:hypothetical protein
MSQSIEESIQLPHYLGCHDFRSDSIGTMGVILECHGGGGGGGGKGEGEGGLIFQSPNNKLILLYTAKHNTPATNNYAWLITSCGLGVWLYTASRCTPLQSR